MHQLLPSHAHAHADAGLSHRPSQGEGKLFSFDLLDKDDGEIRVTGFNDQVRSQSRLHDGLQCYMLSIAQQPAGDHGHTENTDLQP